jgi:hypothetical protein
MTHEPRPSQKNQHPRNRGLRALAVAASAALLAACSSNESGTAAPVAPETSAAATTSSATPTPERVTVTVTAKPTTSSKKPTSSTTTAPKTTESVRPTPTQTTTTPEAAPGLNPGMQALLDPERNAAIATHFQAGAPLILDKLQNGGYGETVLTDLQNIPVEAGSGYEGMATLATADQDGPIASVTGYYNTSGVITPESIMAVTTSATGGPHGITSIRIDGFEGTEFYSVETNAEEAADQYGDYAATPSVEAILNGSVSAAEVTEADSAAVQNFNANVGANTR